MRRDIHQYWLSSSHFCRRGLVWRCRLDIRALVFFLIFWGDIFLFVSEWVGQWVMFSGFWDSYRIYRACLFLNDDFGVSMQDAYLSHFLHGGVSFWVSSFELLPRLLGFDLLLRLLGTLPLKLRIVPYYPFLLLDFDASFARDQENGQSMKKSWSCLTVHESHR